MRSTIMAAAMTAAAAILLGGAAHAQTNGLSQQQDDQPSVGIGVICNTPDEARHFISLRAGGAKAEKAMQSINTEAKDPRACGVAAVVYTRGGIVANEKLDGKLVQIVRINVLAGYNGAGWQRVSDMVQYAVLEGGGETI
ncbi:MAG: hypothetical protein WA792_02990 [Pseudolabrys sp.]